MTGGVAAGVPLRMTGGRCASSAQDDRGSRCGRSAEDDRDGGFEGFGGVEFLGEFFDGFEGEAEGFAHVA